MSNETVLILPTSAIYAELMERMYAAECFDYDLNDLTSVMVEILPDNPNVYPEARITAITRYLSQLALNEEQGKLATTAIMNAIQKLEEVLWSLGVYLNAANRVRFLRFYYHDLAIAISK